MKISHRWLAGLICICMAIACAMPAAGQTPPKAIVIAWDGAVPSFAHEMLRQKKLPNLATLIEGGAFADEVVPAFPSLTASGFASLATGAPARVTGITGNRVPRLPRSQFSIVDSSAAFNQALLRAETLWAAATRAGRKVVVTHVPFGGESSELGVYFQGYVGVAGRDGTVTGRSAEPQPALAWENLPPSAAPPLEITFTIGAGAFFGLIVDDPDDPQEGYDTLLVAGSRDGNDVKTFLKSAPAGRGGELFWSRPVEIKTNDGRAATSYLRLFDLKRDGGDFFLFFTRPTREMASRPDLLDGANPTVRAFIGNGASQLYNQGALGPTLANGGDGTAEARYLETVIFAQHQLMETNRWALQNLPWDLFFAYTPYPDEVEHAWRGFLDPALADFRPELANRLRPFLETVYAAVDDFLGLFLEHRPENSIVALISDHGMEGSNRLVAINKALQRSGLLALDDRGRLDLTRTKVLYPQANSGYLLINSTDRKSGIVTPEERADVLRRVREALSEIKDGERPIVTGVYDAETDGEMRGIGGVSGGDIYLDLLPGYEWDAKLAAPEIVSRREPHGMHGFNPERASMRTLMVINGPGVATGRKLSDVRIIDFAPTLARLVGLPPPRDATGRVLEDALSAAR